MAPHGYTRTRGVRYNRQTESFEMWCPDCDMKGRSATFWPLTLEFWKVEDGLARCRACWLEKRRRDQKGYRAEKREHYIEYNRAYYAKNSELLRWKNNQRKARRKADAASRHLAEGHTE